MVKRGLRSIQITINLCKFRCFAPKHHNLIFQYEGAHNSRRSTSKMHRKILRNLVVAPNLIPIKRRRVYNGLHTVPMAPQKKNGLEHASFSGLCILPAWDWWRAKWSQHFYPASPRITTWNLESPLPVLYLNFFAFQTWHLKSNNEFLRPALNLLRDSFVCAMNIHYVDNVDGLPDSHVSMDLQDQHPTVLFSSRWSVDLTWSTRCGAPRFPPVKLDPPPPRVQLTNLTPFCVGISKVDRQPTMFQ